VLWHCWLGDRKGIRPVQRWVLICWWWQFDCSFARLTAPVVTSTSIILSSNKIQNGDILVLTYPGCPRKWPLNESCCHWVWTAWNSSSEVVWAKVATETGFSALLKVVGDILCAMGPRWMTDRRQNRNVLLLLLLFLFLLILVFSYLHWDNENTDDDDDDDDDDMMMMMMIWWWWCSRWLLLLLLVVIWSQRLVGHIDQQTQPLVMSAGYVYCLSCCCSISSHSAAVASQWNLVTDKTENELSSAGQRWQWSDGCMMWWCNW